MCEVIHDRIEGLYLNVQILVDLDGPSKGKNVLCEVCKLPRIPNAIKHTALFGRLNSLHLLAAPLPGRHHDDELGCAELRCRAADALERRVRVSCFLLLGM